MCCHLAPVTRPERVMKSGEATREAAVTIRPGATCGAPPAQCHAYAGRGSPWPSAGGRDLPCSWCPKEPGPLALAGLGFRSPGGAGPVSPCSSPPPTHTHHADIRVCRPAAKREFGQNFHIQSKTQSHDWVGEA